MSLARITSPMSCPGCRTPISWPATCRSSISPITGHDLAEARSSGAPRGSGALAADPRIKNSEGGDFSDRRARTPTHEPRVRGRVRDSRFSLSCRRWQPRRRDAAVRLYHVTASAHARRPGGDRAHRGEAGASPARGEAGEDRGGARRVRPEMAASLVRHIAARPRVRRSTGRVLLVGSSASHRHQSRCDRRDGTIPGALARGPRRECLAVRRTASSIRACSVLPSSIRRAAELGMPSTHHGARDGIGVSVSRTTCTSPRARPIPPS